MKYLRKYENINTDPFGEEDWNEVDNWKDILLSSLYKLSGTYIYSDTGIWEIHYDTFIKMITLVNKNYDDLYIIATPFSGKERESGIPIHVESEDGELDDFIDITTSTSLTEYVSILKNYLSSGEFKSELIKFIPGMK